MKVSQYVKHKELLKFLQVQAQKPSAMMKLALMRTATGKEDPELPMLQRISSLELTVSHEDRHRKASPRVTSAAEDKLIRDTSLRNCSSNKCFTEFK